MICVIVNRYKTWKLSILDCYKRLNIDASDRACQNLAETIKSAPKQTAQQRLAMMREFTLNEIKLHQVTVQMGNELSAEGFNILNDVVFNQVLVACDTDEITNLTLQYIQESGECWVGGTTSNGKQAIRVSVCSWATTESDITRSVRAFVTQLSI